MLIVQTSLDKASNARIKSFHHAKYSEGGKVLYKNQNNRGKWPSASHPSSYLLIGATFLKSTGQLLQLWKNSIRVWETSAIGITPPHCQNEHRDTFLEVTKLLVLKW